MANNLTFASSPTYDTTAPKFGSGALASGTATSGNAPFSTYPWTIECWIKTTAGYNSGNLEVIASLANQTHLSIQNGQVAFYGAGTSYNINDGNWHHVAIQSTGSDLLCFTDGHYIGFSGFGNQGAGSILYVGGFDSTYQYPYTQETDELALFNYQRYPTNGNPPSNTTVTYTPPTSAFTGSESGLIGLYHFDGNGNDSAGVTPGSVGTAAGTSTATAAGRALSPAMGAAGGSSTATATGKALDNAVGTSAGNSTATGTARATVSAAGSSAGASTATGVGRATDAATGTTAGTSTASAPSIAWTAATGSSAGTSTATATANVAGQSTGIASGTSTAIATGRANDATVGSSAGVSTAMATAQANATGVGAAAGSSTAMGVVAGASTGAATAAGTSTASGVSIPVSPAVGTATGTSTATGASSAATPSAGVSAGTSAATATSQISVAGLGLSYGYSYAYGYSSVRASATGSASGASTANATSPGLFTYATGTAAGSSVATGVGAYAQFPGYMCAAPPYPSDDDALIRFLQSVVAGVTCMDGSLVRPRWQNPDPGRPQRDVTWCGIGITTRLSEGMPAIMHAPDGDGSDTLLRYERLTLMCSFYGPLSEQTAAYLRDGLFIAQNREVLRAAGFALVNTSDFTHAPELVNDGWLSRTDLTVTLRREIRRSYPVLSLLSASGTLLAQGSASVLVRQINAQGS